MNKLLLLGAATGALCVSAAGQAGPYFLPRGDLALYGSYLNQNDHEAGLNPDGGGGGAQMSLSLTRNVFVGGSYQYDYLSESNAPASSLGLGSGQVSYGEKVGQARAGGGLDFHLPLTPLDVFGKVEYTHYDTQFVHVSSGGASLGNGDRSNDDGVGYHAGLQARLPGLSVYGSVGYLDLSKSQGPEFNLGLMLPLAPLTWGFVEYRYDDLRYIGYSDRNESSDVRAGVRLSF